MRVFRTSPRRLPARTILALVAMLAALPLVVSHARAAEEQVFYAPEKCVPAVTDGKVRIMVGRTVLAIPRESLLYIGGMADWKRQTLPPAPDPSQQEGCPANPIWGAYFDVVFQLQISGAEEAGPRSRTAKLVYLNEDYAPMQESIEFFARRRCDEAPPGSIREDLPGGLIRCRYRPDVHIQVERWGTALVAPKSLYTTPGGRLFSVHCLQGELTSGGHGCIVSYRLMLSVGVSYKVDFNRTSMEEIIPLDRALRRMIEDALVPGYVWPEGQRE